MGSRKVDRGTIIILDIGKNVSTQEEKNGKTFFESARECTNRIIARKILSQEKNYIGIILLGSKKTNISIAQQCPGTFKHIELFAELQLPTWQLMRDLPEKTTSFEADWFDSLIVAAEHLKNGVNRVQFINKKIIFMTNFKSQSYFNKNNAEMAINGLKQDNFEVDVFGVDIYENTDKSRDLDLAQKLVHATNGVSVTFDYCMNFLTFYPKKAGNCIPWNVDLSFTPDVKIPVSCYIKIKEESGVKNWIIGVRDPVTKTASTKEGVVKNKVHINSEKQTVVEFSGLIRGFYYGQQIIPFSDCDKSMLYEAGDKSLKLYGFTEASNFDWQHMNGNNLMYVFGRKDDKNAQKAIRCLVECLQEQNLVGIVRRVYNKGNAPKMFALIPVVDGNSICLSMVGICYKEEIKNMVFPSTNLKKHQCTEEQVEAFKDLIKAMDLTKAYNESDVEDTEALPIAETPSPTTQYILDCIAHRAMHPGKPLPKPRDEIKLLFKIPPLVEERSQEPIKKLKNLFVLRKIEVKTRVNKNSITSNDEDKELSSSLIQDNDGNMNDLPRVDIKSIKKTKEINNIGTVNPISDYISLKNNGKALDELSTEMTEVIESLINTNIDGTYSKAMECIVFFRQECVNLEPSYYNNWLKKLKMGLLECKKHDVLELITCKKLDFILKSENNSSTFDNTEEGDSQMYENDTVPTLTDVTVSSQVKNFFDDM